MQSKGKDFSIFSGAVMPRSVCANGLKLLK